jgi:arginase
MPAVDSPGSPGLSFEQLAELMSRLINSGHILGVDVTIYDPDLDPMQSYARAIVDCLANAFPTERVEGRAAI